MNPQSPNFFSSRNYTPAPRDFSSSSNVQGGGSFSQKLKNLSKNTKILIIVAIAAVILISIFATIGNNRKNDTSEITEAEEFSNEFKLDIETLAYYYERTIGFEPKPNHEQYVFFQFQETNNLDAQFSLVQEEWNDMQEKIESNNTDNSEKKFYKASIEKYSSYMAQFEKNINIIHEFKDAFTPFQWKKDLKNGECVPNEKMASLQESDDEDVSNAATKYIAAYCGVITHPLVGDGMNEDDAATIFADNENLISDATDGFIKVLDIINWEDNKNQ